MGGGTPQNINRWTAVQEPDHCMQILYMLHAADITVIWYMVVYKARNISGAYIKKVNSQDCWNRNSIYLHKDCYH